MATMRADDSVASVSSKDSKVYFNVAILQQSECVDVAAMAAGRGWFKGTPAQRKRVWKYWLQRAAMVLEHGPPVGLYDQGVRARFAVLLSGFT